MTWAGLIFPAGILIWLLILWMTYLWEHRKRRTLRLEMKIRRLTVRTETRVAKLRAKQKLVEEIEAIRGRE